MIPKAFNCLEPYFFNMVPYQEDLYEVALFNNNLKLLPNMAESTIIILNYYLKNHLSNSRVFNLKTWRLENNVNIDCKSAIEYFSEDSLDVVMDYVIIHLWPNLVGSTCSLLPKYPIGYNFINSDLLCLALDKREARYANTDRVNLFTNFRTVK